MVVGDFGFPVGGFLEPFYIVGLFFPSLILTSGLSSRSYSVVFSFARGDSFYGRYLSFLELFTLGVPEATNSK